MIETLSRSRENIGNLCRLCLNKELLQDVHQEQDLQRWISEFLAIVISIEDRMSQAICGMCRMRIIEFHHFRMRCQEVQGMFKSMIKRNDDRSLQSVMQSTVVKLECPSESVLSTTQGRVVQVRTGRVNNGAKEAGVGPVGMDDMIVLEAVKIEPPDYEETSEIPVNETTAESNYNVENQDPERTLSAIAESVQAKNGSDNTTSHRCSICHKQYQTDQKLEFHLKSAHGSKDHKCLICGVRFPMLKSLRRHQCTEKRINSLNNTCGNANTSCEKIRKRSKTEHTELQTPDCTSKPERNKKSKLRKTQAHKDSPELAQEISEKNDTDHIQKNSIPSSKNSSDYICTTCDRSFQRKGQLKNHLRSHQEHVAEDLSIDMETIRLSQLSRLTIQLPGIDGIAETVEEKENVKGAKLTVHQCKICSKQLKSHQRLHNHMRNHQPKEHVCKHCGFSFGRRDNLQRHLKTHTKSIFDRPERAESGETLSDEDVRSKENESDRSSAMGCKSDKDNPYIGRLQPFQCNECYRECKTAQNLRYHMRAVHGPKNHVCLTCGVRFSKKNNLKKHLRTKTHLNMLVNNSLQNKLSVTIKEDDDEQMVPTKSKKTQTASLETSAMDERSHSSGTKIENEIGQKESSAPVENSVDSEGRASTASNATDQEGYLCLICNRSFNRQSKLTNHRRVHEEPPSSAGEDEE
nr:zinc finger protein 569-like [Aedes albopictus]XP_029726988.1 zinc finger protein 569-like [Aedes albopictus]